MAKRVNYTHPSGTEYPESYWRIVELIVSVPDKLAKFVFHGYKDEASRNAGKAPIGEKTVIIDDPALFDVKFTEVTLKTKNPQEVGYEYCSDFRDLTREAILNEGTEEQMTVLEHYSFFEDAIDC